MKSLNIIPRSSINGRTNRYDKETSDLHLIKEKCEKKCSLYDSQRGKINNLRRTFTNE